MMAGQVAIYAAGEANFLLLKLVGFYMLAVSVIGVMAFSSAPSGFWIVLVLAPILIAGGYGVIA
jgi:hypothetical protein